MPRSEWVVSCESFHESWEAKFPYEGAAVEAAAARSRQYPSSKVEIREVVHPDEIKFYKLKEPYGCFSNFWMSSILWDHVYWPTSEHLFQSMKFESADHREWIRQQSTAGKAAAAGRTRHPSFRKDWEQVKDDMMLLTCYEKFRQHAGLRETLLSTGEHRLIEHTDRDDYWGDGGDGSGRNQLGITLMKVRSIFGGKGVV